MTPAESAERFWGPAERAEGLFFSEVSMFSFVPF